MRSFVLACLGAALLSGCASVDAIPTSRNDMHTHGFRVPERKPLIVVAGANATVVWVCNNNRQTAVNFGSFLAKHHFVVDFDGCGAVSKIDSEQDNTAVPIALISFIQEAAKQLIPPIGAGLSGTQNNAQGKTSFQIFDVRFNGAGDVDLVPLVHEGELRLVNASGGAVSAGTGGTFGSVPGGGAAGGATGGTKKAA